MYRCTAQAASDVSLFEVSFSQFWEVMELHRLEDAFMLQLDNATEGGVDVLAKDSTHHLVNKFHSNLNKNSKMSHMMSMNPNLSKLYADEGLVILPDSWFYLWWSLASLLCICYLAFTVPFCVAFSEVSLAVVVCDALMCAFFSTDIWLRLHCFAVVDEGELVRQQEHISAIYQETLLRWDLLSTLPIALVVLGEQRETLH